MHDLMIPKGLPSLEEITQQTSDYPQIDPLAIFTRNELQKAARVIDQELERELATHNLSLGRHVTLWCIAVLADNAGITPAEISDQIGVTRATITGLLDALEQDGLVVRKRRTDDRRMVSVYLSAKGRKKIEKVYPVHYQKSTEIFSVLDDDEKFQFIGLLRRLREGVEGKAS